MMDFRGIGERRPRRITEAAKKLLAARTKAQVQQRQMAAALGLHPRTVSRWEMGAAHPSKEQWAKAVAYLAGIVPQEAAALAEAAGVTVAQPVVTPVDVRAIEQALLMAADRLDVSPRRVRAVVRAIAKATAGAGGSLADLAKAAEEKASEAGDE